MDIKFQKDPLPIKPLVNKVAGSALKTINLESFFPTEALLSFDLKEYLFKGLILREKEFRTALKAHDWSTYQDKVLLVFCSADAIIPTWAYMLIASSAEAYVKDIFYGSEHQYLQDYYRNWIKNHDFSQYKGEKIIVKGCSKKSVPDSAYMEFAKAIKPYASSLMFGEACSNVPIFKVKR